MLGRGHLARGRQTGGRGGRRLDGARLHRWRCCQRGHGGRGRVGHGQRGWRRRRRGGQHQLLRLALLGVRRHVEGLAPHQVLVDLVRVLEVLDHHEAHRTHESEHQADQHGVLLVGLRKAHGHGHGEAAQDQHTGVHTTHERVQVVAGVAEHLGEARAQNRVGHEQAAEEKHFGGKEQPHAQLGAVELVRGRLEVVLQERILGVVAVAMVAMVVVRRAVRVGNGAQGRSPFGRVQCSGCLAASAASAGSIS